MEIRASTLLVCLLLASAASAETVYKYRGANGQMTYSNRPIPNAVLVETFDYRFAPARSPAAASVAPQTAAVDDRMKNHLEKLNVAWAELQSATRDLAAAEARLAAGVEPLESDNVALGGPQAEALSPSDVGGAQQPASPAVGGPQPPAQASPGQTQAQAAANARQVGGPMGTRRGGGRNAEYGERVARLEADVVKARARLEVAQLAYNQLR